MVKIDFFNVWAKRFQTSKNGDNNIYEFYDKHMKVIRDND